jgi:predicted RecA/RadA family phage recombinase
MKNFLGHSSDETLTAPVALASGAGALIGATFGVAKSDIAQGARGVFSLTGKFALPKDGNAIGEGVRVYWDNAARVVTASAAAGANTLIGVATVAALAGATTVAVRLNGSF